jgi:flagellar hook-associated protein 2
MTSPSSFNVSGLLGTNSIDTSSLIDQLMQAAAIPQNQLRNQLTIEQAIKSAYQAINTKLSALQTAAQALVNPTIPSDPTAWTATAATSSSTAVVATSTGQATIGTTTFDVTQLASSQVSTVVADVNGVVVSNPAAGITITSADGTAHPINLTSGTAADVASAINAANVGVRASAVQTDTGTVLQLVSSTTGSAAGFTATGFDVAAQTPITAKDAQITVGGAAAGSYTVSRPSNTFTDVIPGVTFTANALATNVTVTVTSDAKSISDKVKALVDAANAAQAEIAKDTGKGAILQGSFDAQQIARALGSAVSNGVAGGGSLKTYGIDVDSNGVFSFDATVFQSAYAADPTATRAAIAGSFAATLNTVAKNASDPITGNITAAMKSAGDISDDLNKRIDAWTARLADIRQRLQVKYTAMNSMLAQLQSRSTYLTNMLKSLNSNSSSSSGN